MDWLIELLTSGGGVAHTVILYAMVISLGVLLGGKIKFGGISLGVTSFRILALFYLSSALDFK